MIQRVRFRLDGEWHEADLEVDGRRLRGWLTHYGSLERFVADAISYYTSHAVHQQLQNTRRLMVELKKAPLDDVQIGALLALGLKNLGARIDALERFAEAEKARIKRWDETREEEGPE